MVTTKSRRRKTRILRHAAELFAARGFETVSIEQIAAASRLTRTAIYYYFPSKEAILAELWKSGWRLLWKTVHPLNRRIEDDPMETLIEALTGEYRIFRRYEPLMRCLFRMGALARGTREFHSPAAERYRRAYLNFHRRLIETGIDRGVFRPVDIRMTMRAIHGMIMGLMSAGTEDQEAVDRKVLVDVIRRFLA